MSLKTNLQENYPLLILIREFFMCMVDLLFLARTISVNSINWCCSMAPKVRVLYRCTTCLLTPDVLTNTCAFPERDFDNL